MNNAIDETSTLIAEQRDGGSVFEHSPLRIDCVGVCGGPLRATRLILGGVQVKTRALPAQAGGMQDVSSPPRSSILQRYAGRATIPGP